MPDLGKLHAILHEIPTRPICCPIRSTFTESLAVSVIYNDLYCAGITTVYLHEMYRCDFL